MKKYSLIVIVILAIAIRMVYANTRSFFNNCDELISVTTATGLVYEKIPLNTQFTTKQVLTRTFNERLTQCAKGGYGGDNGNSYFFNFVFSYWTDVFGLSNLAFRSFSIVFDCLSIILLYVIANFLGFNSISIGLSCLMLAISPIFLSYGGGFIRTYAFTAFLALLSFLVFIKIYNNPQNKVNYFWLVLILVSLFFSHFLTYYIFAVYVFFAWIKRKESLVFFKRILMAVSFAGVLCVLGLYLNKDGFSDMQKRNESLEKSAAVVGGLENNNAIQFTPKTISLSVFKYFLSFYSGSFSLVAFAKALGLSIIPMPFFFLLLLFPVFLFAIQYKEVVKCDKIFLLWLFVLAGNASALAIMFFSKHFTSLDIRYTMFSIPFFFILITQVKFNDFKQLIIPLLFLVINGVNLIGTFNRNLTGEINLEIAEKEKKFITKDIPEIESYFADKLKNIKATDVLKFNNADDFIFFTLLTKANINNPCIIDNKSTNGITILNSEKSNFISFKYYGA